MIVFGDPEFSRPARVVLMSLRAQVERSAANSLDDLRTLLIQAGQLEQAVEDAGSAEIDEGLLNRIREVTDRAATAFCDRWFSAAFLRLNGAEKNGSSHTVASECMAQISAALLEIQFPDTLALRIKVPEGFQFYALYPEQYCASAVKWAEANPDYERALVVGIRSIGTALSAVVRATLLATGRSVDRCTVRPSGHPFERDVALPALNAFQYRHALIVDEGPGLSGSSMVATARAVQNAGIESIALLPGHDHAPGSSASAETLDIWRNTPRHVTALDELRWHRWSLMESLPREASRIFAASTGAEPGDPDRPEVHPAWRFIYSQAVQTLYGIVPESEGTGTFDLVQDCSGGLWRRYAFHSESDWPPVAAQFERMKFRCADHQGGAVLWKFCGLGANTGDGGGNAALMQRLYRLSNLGFTVAPLGAFRGFIAQPWIEGVRLTIADGIDVHILKRVGEYILAAADPRLSELEMRASVSRLSDVLYWNTHEALGEPMAERTRELVQAVGALEPVLGAGDGHLAPHEWILSAAARHVLKLDCEGHGADHTIVGRQPIHWDVAGAIVEWDLDTASAAPLLAPLENGGTFIEPTALPFFVAAYSAFRMGLMSLTLDATTNPAERARLQHAFYFYQNKLAQILNTLPAASRAVHSVPLPSPTSHQSPGH
ncbi:MAG TPA: hypothetical protein VEH04_08750 [Verrucomicrobiae bacterium]|nr:hypothetical protein [Verrucomicrobiae bacterium]